METDGVTARFTQADIARAKPQGRELPTDKWKALFMDAIGIPADWEPGINGGVVNVGYRSSRLTKQQMSDLIEQMYAYGAEHGVEWTEPLTDPDPMRRAA